MKKLVLMAFAAVALVSCSDDDNENVALTGTWKLTAFNLDEGVDLNNDGTASTSLITESGCYNNSTVVFGSGNSATFNIQELDIDYEIITGTQNSYEYSVDCLAGENETATYTVSGNNVAFTIGGEPVVFIQNGNKLTATLVGGGVPVNDNGETDFQILTGTVEFTKQ
ncbi:MAG: hypothetical protein EOP54_23920 [Sphingobacteriales bacterium]|nr:MAG: hypothetical protein EOP54_23920 [Sphingobacteriales bacterium]